MIFHMSAHSFWSSEFNKSKQERKKKQLMMCKSKNGAARKCNWLSDEWLESTLNAPLSQHGVVVEMLVRVALTMAHYRGWQTTIDGHIQSSSHVASKTMRCTFSFFSTRWQQIVFIKPGGGVVRRSFEPL